MRLCHKSVHGSTGSPRTDHGTPKDSYLAVRPEHVEGRTANYDTVSVGRGRFLIFTVWYFARKAKRTIMAEQKRLSGKVAIVTGAAGGLGAPIAKTLAREGVTVAVADINIQEARRVESEIRESGGSALAIQFDVTQARQVAGMVQEVLDQRGAVDILVNNAGGFHKFSSLLDIAEQEWDQVVTLNLKSVFLCCQAVAKHMIERQKGRIVNIASRAGIAPNPGGPDYLPYGAAKAGVMGFTRLLASQVGPYGITVNSISPSTVLTERVRKLRDPESLEQIAKMAPLRHLVEPQDIAEAVLFLVSEGSRFITGINLNVNSGNFMI